MQNLYYISFGAFLFGVILFAMLEVFFVKRKYTDDKTQRWTHNFSLTVFNTLIIRILPFTPVLVAAYAMKQGWGIFNVFEIHILLEILLTIIIFDFIIYWQHVAFHKVPLLWRFHKVHHSDLDLDFTTALRFHIGEIFISILIKGVVIVLLGFHAIPVLIFEMLLNFSAMFNHANIKLPRKLNTIISKFIVTPDFHEMHHSDKQPETDSNYGFFLSIWDYAFRSYTSQEKGADKIGLNLKKKPSVKQLFLTNF